MLDSDTDITTSDSKKKVKSKESVDKTNSKKNDFNTASILIKNKY